MISDRAGEFLVNLSKETIKYYLDNGKIMVKPTDYPIELDEELGVFVTLNKNNNLICCNTITGNNAWINNLES